MSGSADTAIGVLGVDLDANDVSALHDQGLAVATRDGAAIYAKAAANSPAFSLCKIIPSSAAASGSVEAVLVSTGNIHSAQGILAINQADVSATQYGWFYTEGRRSVRVRVLIACEPFVPLYTTGTGGVVDDAVVSAGRVEGLQVLASAASASAPQAIFSNMVPITQDIA